MESFIVATTCKQTVVICDDHPIFLAGLKSVLVESGKFHIKATCTSLEEWDCSMEGADVLVCDVNLGSDRAGFSLVENLTQPNSFGRIVILTAYDEIFLMRRARELGAWAYVRKDASMEALVTVLHDDRTDGFRVIAPDLPEDHLDRVDGQSDIRLSKRELEVLSLVIDGLSSSQIGERLFTSRVTIETHRRNIYRKTKATNIIELSRITLKHGWLTGK